MGQLIPFEDRALARLRKRLGEAQEANDDLVAFARGHSGAVASIHAAVLVAIEAPSIDRLFEAVTRQWPEILGIDAVAIAILVGKLGFRADCGVVERVEAAFVERMLSNAPAVDIRSVGSGHPLFGAPAAPRIRAQALIRIDSAASFPRGLLALGQEAELALDSSHGSEQLRFLGKTVEATCRRFVAAA